MSALMNISVDGQQSCGEQSDRITLQTTGSLVKKGDYWYVSYTEYGENNTSVAVTLKISDERAVMLRGPLSRMEFLPCRETYCSYATDFGTLELMLRTESIACSLSADGGTVRLVYSLFADDSFLSRNDVSITVSPAVG